MNTLLSKCISSSSRRLNCSSSLLTLKNPLAAATSTTANTGSLINQPSNGILAEQQSKRSHFTFSFPKTTTKYIRATRPKKSNDDSLPLTYEQSQFAHKLGVTKSWNTWNTSNLLGGKRQAENASDDILIRKFLFGTFHDLFASEIVIKRKLNTINVGFLVRLPNRDHKQKIYFLVGYAEELLSCLFKCVVKIQVQSVYNTKDLVFRHW